MLNQIQIDTKLNLYVYYKTILTLHLCNPWYINYKHAHGWEMSDTHEASCFAETHEVP